MGGEENKAVIQTLHSASLGLHILAYRSTMATSILNHILEVLVPAQPYQHLEAFLIPWLKSRGGEDAD